MWDIDVPWVSVSGLIQSDLLPRVPLTLSTLLPSPPCISAQVNPWYQMEFMGCFIMIIFGDGSVAQVLLSANPNLPPSSQNKGDYQSISWGYVSLSKSPPISMPAANTPSAGASESV